MTKFINSFFILSLLFVLYGCGGSTSTASSGISLGNKQIGMMDSD
jgi:hypothetical protein